MKTLILICILLSGCKYNDHATVYDDLNRGFKELPKPSYKFVKTTLPDGSVYEFKQTVLPDGTRCVILAKPPLYEPLGLSCDFEQTGWTYE